MRNRNFLRTWFSYHFELFLQRGMGGGGKGAQTAWNHHGNSRSKLLRRLQREHMVTQHSVRRLSSWMAWHYSFC